MKTSIPWRKRLAMSAFSRWRHAQASLHPLTYLFWECTLRCNLACRHCGSDCQVSARQPDMALEDFLGVLDRVATISDPAKTMVAITGGEPLMREDLAACGRAISERGFPWGMVSNGWALDQKQLDGLLASGLRSLTISLDGLEASHDWLRGKSGSYQRALAAIRCASAVPGIAFDVVTCVTPRNISELDSLRTVLLESGVPAWRIFNIFAKGRAATDPELATDGGLLKKTLDFVRQARGSGGLRVNYACEGYLGPYEYEARDGFYNCRAGTNIASVLADGSISACPSLRGDFIQGNMYRDDFVDVWNTRYQNMRDRAWLKTGICRDCSSWKWCEGNALHLRDDEGGLARCHLALLKEAGLGD